MLLIIIIKVHVRKLEYPAVAKVISKVKLLS